MPYHTAFAVVRRSTAFFIDRGFSRSQSLLREASWHDGCLHRAAERPPRRLRPQKAPAVQ
jgi:N-acetylglutamate synthase-like GNAT family acetyltransferase